MIIMAIDPALILGYGVAHRQKMDGAGLKEIKIIDWGTIYTLPKKKELAGNATFFRKRKHHATFEELLDRINHLAGSILPVIAHYKPEAYLLEKLNLDFDRGMNRRDLQAYTAAWVYIYSLVKQFKPVYFIPIKGRYGKAMAEIITKQHCPKAIMSSHAREACAWLLTHANYLIP